MLFVVGFKGVGAEDLPAPALPHMEYDLLFVNHLQTKRKDHKSHVSHEFELEIAITSILSLTFPYKYKLCGFTMSHYH